MKTLAKIFLILSLCFLGIIFLFPFEKGAEQGREIINNKGYCGVGDSSEYEAGKKVFKTNCASCHKLDKRLVGPALFDVDSIVLWSWVTLRKEKIEQTTLYKSGIDYHKRTFGEKLNPLEMQQLYDYLKYQ